MKIGRMRVTLEPWAVDDGLDQVRVTVETNKGKFTNDQIIERNDAEPWFDQLLRIAGEEIKSAMKKG